MEEWENDVRRKIAKDNHLKRLVADFPLVILQSSHLYSGGKYDQSVFNFTHGTNNPKIHGGIPQLGFDRGGKRKQFKINMYGGQQNVVAVLGKVDFRKDPDPKAISIDDAGVIAGGFDAVEGMVYLQWIRDYLGNDFYALFQVITVDPDSRYVALVSRRLPDGRTSKKLEAKPALWEQDVRKRLAGDEKLKSLAAEYPLVILESRAHFGADRSAFSFIFEASDVRKHGNHVQIEYDGGPGDRLSVRGDLTLIVDLGPGNLEKTPDPKEIKLAYPGVRGWWVAAAEGHVYLVRVRDNYVGNNFYAVFQVVAVDPYSQYMAFLWRRLPGGKVVKKGLAVD